ncbi:hypothetical protein ABIE21_002681 [Conyzicola nivalis]|uniref:Iron-containing redox enzyme family protein n=1 Tax=Conyzicola nivalis TaxID=1477021 RepID=A0ABV2QQB6_9MICO
MSVLQHDLAVTAFPMEARGPLSTRLTAILSQGPDDSAQGLDLSPVAEAAVAAASSVVRDDDVQLSLFILYGLHYGSFPAVSADWEWHPALVAARRVLERAFEDELRATVAVPPLPRPTRVAVARALSELTSADSGPSLSRYIAKKATREQLGEFLIQRSVYTLREADPHSWAIPRLTGRAKAALVEIQADEYGGGRPARMHSEIFATTMEEFGLDRRYGRYVDEVPAITLASLNVMSMFGLNRRLLGAIVGHLAAFEMTSSIPNAMYANGFRRLGYGVGVTAYFDEHVAADAVHEQIAANDLAGALAEDEPALLPDILFGAAACLVVDGWAGAHILDSWTADRSSLRSGTP